MSIQFDHVSFSFPTLTGTAVPALHDIHLEIKAGDVTGIAGCSGSGKTTLIRHLNGLLRPSQGEIHFSFPGILNASESLFHQIGLVFQFPEAQLFEESVYEDIAFGPKNMGLEKGEIDQRVQSALAQVGLDALFLNRSPFHLSGGEQRRVAMAGVLSMQPQVLALDEPTAGMDREGIACVERMIQTYSKQNKTVLFICHDMDWMLNMANSVILLKDGRCLFHGNKTDLVRQPHLFETAGLKIPDFFRIRDKVHLAGLEVPETVCSVRELGVFLEGLGVQRKL